MNERKKLIILISILGVILQNFCQAEPISPRPNEKINNNSYVFEAYFIPYNKLPNNFQAGVGFGGTLSYFIISDVSIYADAAFMNNRINLNVVDDEIIKYTNITQKNISSSSFFYRNANLSVDVFDVGVQWKPYLNGTNLDFNIGAGFGLMLLNERRIFFSVNDGSNYFSGRLTGKSDNTLFLSATIGMNYYLFYNISFISKLKIMENFNATNIISGSFTSLDLSLGIMYSFDVENVFNKMKKAAKYF